MSSPTAITQPASTGTISFLIVALRRLASRFIDSIIIGVFTAIGLCVVWVVGLALTAIVGASIGASVGGLDGLEAGGIALFASLAAVFILAAAVMVAVPALYYRWAARRIGPAQGQTVGHATMRFRVLREDGLPMRGRTFWWRTLMLGITLVPLVIPGSVVEAITHSHFLGNLAFGLTLLAVAAKTGFERLPHDRMAGTFVLDLSSPSSATTDVPETPARATWLSN